MNRVSMKNVQQAFSQAIRQRDCICMIRDNEPCFGELQCSHFFTQGSSPSLMFYPMNAYAQCSRHHWNHHNKKECKNVYFNFMKDYHHDELAFMNRNRNKSIRYTNDLKRKIIKLCRENRLEDLRDLIRAELEKA